MGKRLFENALAQFPHHEDVEVVYKSYQLDPKGAKYSGQSISQLLAAKYGMSLEEAIQANEQIAQQAAKLGLDYNLDGMKPTNTLAAHCLAQYAKTEGKDQELIDKIYHAYFVEGKVISEPTTLIEAAELAGLDKNSVMAVLKDSSIYESDVERDQAQAQKIGVNGVPFFLISNKYSIFGAQPVKVILDSLTKAYVEKR